MDEVLACVQAAGLLRPNRSEIVRYAKLIFGTERVYSINDTLGQAYSFEDLGLSIQHRLPRKACLLILVGQQGSGKTSVAKLLPGWMIINEAEAGSIKRGLRLNRILDAFEQLKRGKLPGIVVDASNPKPEEREKFVELAQLHSVAWEVGWIARPGYCDKRAQAIPRLALEMYAKNFVRPDAKRLV